MKKRHRLTRADDFTRLLRDRRLYGGRGLLGFAVARGDERVRVGVTCSREIKGSVRRNRARRRLREVARLVLLAEDSGLAAGGIGYDVVLIARPAALELPFDQLQAEAEAFLRKVKSGP